MENNNIYNEGDQVLISRKLSVSGHWEKVEQFKAKILEVRPTVTYGPAYVVEISGKRCNICYWESDIDGFYEAAPKKDPGDEDW